MEIGISTASFFSKSTTEDSFQLIKSLGFETIEIFLTTFREYEASFVEKLAPNNYGLKTYSVHTLNQQFEPELFNSVKRTQEDAEYFFRKTAVAAKILGANYYTFHGPARLQKRPYNFDFAKLGERVDELDAILNSYSPGLSLAYENVHWTYFSEPQFFSGLKKYSNVKCCLDIKQAMQSKIPLKEYIEVMADRLTNIHICDYDSNGKLFCPGQGEFNFKEFFIMLQANGYNGPILMELYAKDYQSYKEIEESRNYLCNILESINGG